ncbi:MAG: holo-ACP synthase [Hydrogeniiclostridium sp.]|nr:holo-ACP synthase [Clostridiales bacterium]
MIALGIDLLEIDRIRRSLDNPRFLRRVFGPQELEQLAARGFSPQSAAACFCAKEAFSKALGTGVRGFLLTEVQLLREPAGRPYLSLSGDALRLAEERGWDFSVSVTHTKQYAAVVVAAEPRAK